MFSAWGAFIYRFRRPVALLAIVVAIASGSLASKVTSSLSAGGWTDPGSESTAVTKRLTDDFGAGGGSIVAVYQGAAGADARSTTFQDAITASLARLVADDRVESKIGWAETHDDRFVSTDGRAAYVVIRLAITDEAAVDQMPELRGLIDRPAGITLRLTGVAPATQDQAAQSEHELIQAETVSFPFAALILVLVFASLVAAGLPLLVAALAIPTTLGGVYLAAQVTELSIYVQNVATMLGLALAIDYSLFMVSRFREELRRGRDVGTAVRITVATSGKAVTFSGLAVAVGLSGLLLFQPTALRSFGIGGALTVGASVFFALTFLPAVLGMIGTRVNALSVAGLRDRIRRVLGRPVGVAADRAAASRWERMAHAVMARPFVVLLPTLALLLVLGTPFLRLSQGIPDASVLPPGIESREASVALSRDFRAGETSPIVVLATVGGSPIEAANIQRILDLASKIDAVDHVDRVEGPFAGLKDPATGADLDAAGIAALYAAPRDQLPAALAAGLTRLEDAYIRGSIIRLDAISPLAPLSPAGTEVVPNIRAVAVDGVTTQVGGLAAQGKDFMASQSATIPYAIALTLGASAVILFLLFGSVIIPLKAVRGAGIHLPGGPLRRRPRLPVARVHHRRQPDHHVQRVVRTLDGLRGAAAVAHPGGLPADRLQHGVGRGGPGPNRGRHHRRGPDHGDGVQRLRPGRIDHDQEHRRRHGHRRADRCDRRAGAPRAGDDAADGPLELVGPGTPRPIGRSARVQPRRGRRRRAGRVADAAGVRGGLAWTSAPMV